jgi:hypothetical protein
MKGTTSLPITIILACICASIHAQTSVSVSEPELSYKNGLVQIDYDLVNSSKSEKFTVRIEVTNARGNPIPARSLSGDLGEDVSGGSNKRILWDIEADSIFLDEEIFVEVYALPETPPVTLKPPEPEPNVTETGETATESTEPAAKEGAAKEFNRTALIVQSLAFPGLGMSRANPGKPHWIRGVAGYGCIAGAVVLNRVAYSTYQSYLNAENSENVDNLFDKARSQKTTSEVLGYAAIGVWVADLVWNILGTSGMNKSQLTENLKGFSVGTTLEPVSAVPVVAMRYRF